MTDQPRGLPIGGPSLCKAHHRSHFARSSHRRSGIVRAWLVKPGIPCCERLSSITSDRDQSPNRGWFAATEIDYAWSFVGGSQSLINALLGDGRLEALPARLTGEPVYDSDRVNVELDAL